MARRRATNTPKLNAERVRLDRGGYVETGQAHAGRYFGTGEPLFRVTDGEMLDEYVRARTQKEAKAKVLQTALANLARTTVNAVGTTKYPLGPGEPHPSTSQATNLEGLTDSELAALAKNRRADSRYRDMAKILQKARKFRLAGKIMAAQRAEDDFQRLYDKLPATLRW